MMMILSDVHGSLSPDTETTHKQWRHSCYQYKKLNSYKIDNDGDLIVTRRQHDENDNEEETCHNKTSLMIRHRMKTSLDNVGEQIWLATFLLADVLLHEDWLNRCCGKALMHSITIELGAGTGFISALVNQLDPHGLIYCTDVRHGDMLSNCMFNCGHGVRVRELDWRSWPPIVSSNSCSRIDERDTDMSSSSFLLSNDEFSSFNGGPLRIIAADCIYDNDLTDALLNTIISLLLNAHHGGEAILTMERRIVFTLADCAPASPFYSYFVAKMTALIELTEGKLRCVHDTMLPPQYFDYERTTHIELWRIHTVHP